MKFVRLTNKSGAGNPVSRITRYLYFFNSALTHMSPDQINIACALLLGWTQISKSKWKGPDGRINENWTGNLACPNYYGDLNACHEMEKSLFPTNDWRRAGYHNQLTMIVNRWIFHASASQRCEAFLRIHNKWP